MLLLRILCTATIVVVVTTMSMFKPATVKTPRRKVIPNLGSFEKKDGTPKYGYWNFTVRSALSISDDVGQFCDALTKCDTYVKIRIDGREVWRSKTHWDTALPKFFESYHSPRIKKGSLIVIEMWDDDNELVHNEDDFMDRWWSRSPVSLNRRTQLIGRPWESTISPNKLFIESHWKDD